MSYAKKMAQLAAANRKAAQAAGALNEDSKIDSPNEHQTAVVYDLISEGPVEGLQGGTDGIYLDKTPATIGTAGQKFNVRNSNNVSYNSSNHTVTDNNSTLFDNLAVTDGERYIRIKGAKKTADNASATKGTVVITTGSSFFAEDDESRNDVEGIANLKQYIRLAGAGYRGSALVAEVVRYVSATQVEINRPIVTTVSSVNVTIDAIKKIATITNASTATVSDVTEFGTTDRTVSNVDAELSSAVVSITGTPVYNHQNFQYAFKNGTRSQNWLSTFRGIGSSSVIHSASQQVAQTDLSTSVGIPVDNTTSGGYHSDTSDASASPITISAATMGVSNQSEIDKVKLTFKFPQIIASKKSSGKEASTFVELRMFLGFKRPGDSSFTEVLLKGPSNADLLARPSNQRTRNFDGEHGFNSGYIRANTKTPFVESFTLDLGPFQPISDYQIKIERVNPTNARHGDYDHLNPCELVSIENIIEDKLSYPLSAYAATIFDAQSFAKLPTRAYDVKGLKVKVPTNYFPRGEDGRTAAEYDRNVTSGANEGSYQQWDGNFRGDTDTFNNSSANFSPVWTDNPAWVYYDLVTNNRYGIGKYITEDQIDKYELFKIAKYCDELVSDGKGGTEPRFTCNLYLQESDEAFKVLQNVASIFRGMLYWFDGLMQFSQNRYQTPVYTFNKSNVIAGMFKYTSSKKQYRSNQVNVTWNDPEAFFKKAVETVEDTNNILETGKVVTKDVVAFGCTSRGQAHRFGKWTLLTELMETEGIAFDTSINAGYLKPGDVIFVQDSAKEQIRNSGRISTGSTTTAIKVDSAVDLSSGNTYKLSIIYPTGGAFLAQETAVIDSTTFNRGDLILQANIGGSVTTISTSQQAQNALDDSGNLLDLSWNPNSRVETQTISSTGASTTTINVSSAFSSAPPQDAAWAIREIATDGTLESGSAQQYIISAINNTEKGIYNIAALKYEPAKFDLVDRGYVLDVGIDTNKPPSYQDEVPVPKSLTLAFVAGSVESVESEGVDLESSTGSLRVSWQHPTSTRTDSAGNSVTSKYEHLNNYQIRHNASGRAIFETILVDKDTNHIDIPVQRLGRITVQIQTVNTGGIKSAIVQKRINTKEEQISSIPNTKSRIGRLPTGGDLNVSVSINSSSGVLDFSSATYEFITASGITHNFTSTATANKQQAFNGMGASAEAFLVFDNDDTSDHLKAIEIKTDTTAEDAGGNKLNFEYLAEVGASNAGISSASGTATISLEESTVTGSSTAFLTDYSVGDRFIINAAGTTRFFATVTNITSDTEMEIDNPVPRAYSGASIFKLSYKPDFVRDTVIAKIVTDGSTAYSINTLFAVTAGVVGGTGLTGLKTATGQLFFQQESASAPAVPSNPITFTFSNGSFSGTDIGTSGATYNRTPPTATGGASSSKTWFVYYVVTESSSGSGTGTVSVTGDGSGNALQATSFTGLVTFSGGQFSQNGSGITTIDGDHITTGSLKSTNHAGNTDGSGFTSAGTIFNLNNGSLSSQNFRIASDGSASYKGTLTIGGTDLTATNTLNSNTTATDVGLGNVDNDSTATILGNVNQSFIAGKITDAASFRTDIAAYASNNPSGFTTFAASDVQNAIANDVTSISGSKITTGTLNAANVSVINLNASNISTGTLAAARIATSDIVIGDLSGASSFKGALTNITNPSSSTTPIGAGDVNTNVTAISGGAITTGTINSDRLNVNTLNVKHFANVSADIESHVSGEFVPLGVFGSATQRASTDFTTQTQVTGNYCAVDVDNVRNGAQYQAIWSGVYGDCTAGFLEYSVDGGTTFVQAAGGLQDIDFDVGTFRTYTFAYHGEISGLPTTGTNRKLVKWRIRWVTKLRSTYQSLYVFIDNTQ